MYSDCFFECISLYPAKPETPEEIHFFLLGTAAPYSDSELQSILLSIWRKKNELLSGIRILQGPSPNNQRKFLSEIWSMSKSITIRGCGKKDLWMLRAFLVNMYLRIRI